MNKPHIARLVDSSHGVKLPVLRLIACSHQTESSPDNTNATPGAKTIIQPFYLSTTVESSPAQPPPLEPVKRSERQHMGVEDLSQPYRTSGSLRNIQKEVAAELGISMSRKGSGVRLVLLSAFNPGVTASAKII